MTIEQRFEQLDSKLDVVTEFILLFINTLTTHKAVSNYLGKSEKTINNYINNNTFIMNYHYFINENNKVVFIPSAILEFKLNPKHKLQILEPKKEEKIILSKTSTKILKGFI